MSFFFRLQSNINGTGSGSSCKKISSAKYGECKLLINLTIICTFNPVTHVAKTDIVIFSRMHRGIVVQYLLCIYFRITHFARKLIRDVKSGRHRLSDG